MPGSACGLAAQRREQKLNLASFTDVSHQLESLSSHKALEFPRERVGANPSKYVRQRVEHGRCHHDLSSYHAALLPAQMPGEPEEVPAWIPPAAATHILSGCRS